MGIASWIHDRMFGSGGPASPFTAQGYRPPMGAMPQGSGPSFAQPAAPSPFQRGMPPMFGQSGFMPSSSIPGVHPLASQTPGFNGESNGAGGQDDPFHPKETPWWQNPTVLQAVGGLGQGILQSRMAGAQREQNQQTIDLNKQQYDDEQKKKAQQAELMGPILARLLGQWNPPKAG